VIAGCEVVVPHRNYTRRAVGAALCLAPVALVVASAVTGRYWPRTSPVGLAIVVGGLAVAGLNVYLAVIRPSLYVRRHGSTEGYRHVSGLPLVGTGLVVVGGAVGFADWRVAAVGLVVLAADLGGLPWFLVAAWSDRSLWDE
jgi:hypothetical protein